MEIPKLMMIPVVAMLVAGCIPNKTVSIFPLYDEDSLTTDSALAGTWSDGEHESWTFKALDGKKYQLSIVNEDGKAGESTESDKTEFEAHLVQLAGQLFLDLYTEDAGSFGAPAHVFATIQIQKDTLHLAWFDVDWMKEKLKQEPYLSYSTTSDGKVILTARTRDLQYFFSRNAWSAGEDSARTKLHRLPNQEGNSQ
jgi:hypothetical protein